MHRDIVLFVYFFVLIILSIYGFHRYQLIYLFYKYKKNRPVPQDRFQELPRVTIQLPIFNEMYVTERLIDSVCLIDYPKDRLQIQVLDDSIDETCQISQAKVKEYQQKGFDIVYLHRENRQGFKAGALEEGIKSATGEYIAIFDADFVPHVDFLHNTIHFFTDPQIALVQARWGHLNRDYSLMTEVQSIMLDGHLMVEQTARNTSGRFFNFNGTAGIWRRLAITDAGGWHHDTLTEDLDLSFRAQLKGWKFIFLPHVVAPAELPVEVNAFKSQQHRWAKGSVQTCRKLLIPLWKSSVPLKIKLEGTVQLTHNFAYLFMSIFCLLIYPALIYRTSSGWLAMLLVDVPLFILATISISTFYIVSQKEIFTHWLGRLKYLPFVTALGIGLCVNNTKAVFEALFGYKTGFVRTPKSSAMRKAAQQNNIRYRVRKNLLPYFELGLAIYFTLAMYTAFAHKMYAPLPFLFLFQFGFFYMSILSLIQYHHAKAAVEKIHIDDGKENLAPTFLDEPVQEHAA